MTERWGFSPQHSLRFSHSEQFLFGLAFVTVRCP